MVDGVDTDEAGYLAAPAGRCRSVSTADADEDIAQGYLERMADAEPEELPQLVAALKELVPEWGTE